MVRRGNKMNKIDRIELLIRKQIKAITIKLDFYEYGSKEYDRCGYQLQHLRTLLLAVKSDTILECLEKVYKDIEV